MFRIFRLAKWSVYVAKASQNRKLLSGFPKENIVAKKQTIDFSKGCIYNNIVGRTTCISDQDA